MTREPGHRSETTQRQENAYCEVCSLAALKQWKGWPHRDAVPVLPRVESGVCQRYGDSTAALASSSVIWVNYHGPLNTGLPDYWLLAVDDKPRKWGLPYYAEGICPTCGDRSIISEMNYPNGTRELKHNCANCGVEDCHGQPELNQPAGS